MSTFYLMFEICALLTVIVLPLAGPKKIKAKRSNEKSNLYVTEDGNLEYMGINKDDHHPVL